MANGKDARKNKGMKKTEKEHSTIWEKTEQQKELERIRRKKASNLAKINELETFDPHYKILKKMGCTEVEALRTVLESTPETRKNFDDHQMRMLIQRGKVLTKEEAMRILRKSELAEK